MSFMRLLNFFRLKSCSIIKRNFNSIETNENALMYSLLKIEFNFYKMNVIDLYNVFEAHNERKSKRITTKLVLSISK